MVERHLEGRPAVVVALYGRFVSLVEACSPFACSVSKSAITFKGSHRGFAGAKPKDRSLDGNLDLQRVVTDPRIRSSAPYTRSLFVHHFRITSVDQLDEEFSTWSERRTPSGRGRTCPRGDPAPYRMRSLTS